MSEQLIAPADHPMYNWSKPGRVGPGSWYTFLLSAYISDTPEKRTQTCDLIRAFCDHFKCGDCSGHCKKYVEANPPELACKTPRTLFNWIITFMNAVNYRLTKPGYDDGIMWQLFDSKEFHFCNKDCDGKKEVPGDSVRTDHIEKTYKRNVPSRFAQTIPREQSRVSFSRNTDMNRFH